MSYEKVRSSQRLIDLLEALVEIYPDEPLLVYALGLATGDISYEDSHKEMETILAKFNLAALQGSNYVNRKV